MMPRSRIALVALSVLVLGPAVALAAPEQQPPAATVQEPGRSPAEILLRLEPPPPTPADGITADDLRELPRPRPDGLPGNVRIRVGIEDPRCLPGDDLLLLDRLGRPPLRRPVPR
jgi:hypothetical protein